MKLYDWECKQCGHKFEDWLNKKGYHPPKCPKCTPAHTVVVRLMPAPMGVVK